MKTKAISLFVLILAGFFIFYTSCKKDDSSTNNNNNNNNPTRTDTLHVVVYTTPGTYVGNADVKLYSTISDRDNDVNSKYSAKTDIASPSKKGAVFFKIPAGMYYIKASFVIGVDYYEGKSQINVTANTTVTADFATPKILTNGDLHVMVHHGPTYYTGVNVQLFLTESDRTNNQDGTTNFQYQAANTIMNSSFDSIYATFYSLPYQKYYIKAIIPLGPWKGTAEAIVKRVAVQGTNPTIVDLDCN